MVPATPDVPFQVMPSLSEAEYAALADDIAEHGVRVPVVIDQHGRLLDGHHRRRIADDLGLEYPVETVVVNDDDHARQVARTLNMARRHLTRAQRRDLIAAELEADPDRSDRAIGRLLGVDHKTVGSVRRELRGEVPHHDDGPEQVRAREVTDDVRLALAQFHDAIAEGYSNGLPAGFILETSTVALREAPIPDEVRAALRRMLAPIFGALAIDAADERSRGIVWPVEVPA